jgi:hypothetical protein
VNSPPPTPRLFLLASLTHRPLARSCICVRTSADGSLFSTSTGAIVAVADGGAVALSSGASHAVVRSARAAAAAANLSFCEEPLNTKQLAGSNCSVMAIRGVTSAFNLRQLFEYKNRALVSVWQQKQPPPPQFLTALNTHLTSNLDRQPLFSSHRTE